MAIKKRYYWKELSNDGLLKEPAELGPHYDRVPINGYDGGYVSEEEAVQALVEFGDLLYEWSVPSELVLIPVYEILKD